MSLIDYTLSHSPYGDFWMRKGGDSNPWRCGLCKERQPPGYHSEQDCKRTYRKKLHERVPIPNRYKSNDLPPFLVRGEQVP